MKAEIDKFDKNYHKQVLKNFRNKLIECGIKSDNPIVKIAIDPRYISYISNLIEIRNKTKKIIIDRQEMTVLVPINFTVIKVYESDDSFIEVNVGMPTNKGYRSKKKEYEYFVVDQHLNLTSKSIEEMIQFVHIFKIWGDWADDKNFYSTSYEKYSGAYGFDDDTIDSAFEGVIKNGNIYFESYKSRLNESFIDTERLFIQKLLIKIKETDRLHFAEISNLATEYKVENRFELILETLLYDGYLIADKPKGYYSFYSIILKYWWK